MDPSIAAITEPPALSQAAGSLPAARNNAPGAFGALLSAHQRDPASPEAARKAAEELVSIAFIQPVLAQLRENNHAAAPFAPGPAEKAFQPLLDAEIAQRIVQRTDYGLVDAVARRLLRTDGQAASARPAEVDAHA